MPRLGKTGLYYWGRKVMENHNFPDNDLTDGIWGPESGPNWPAWRVLKTDKMDLLNKNGKFQGYSGMIYWGKNWNKKSKGHDGLCGPDNGPPWDECLNEILNEVDDSQKRSEIICSKIDGPFVDSEDKNLKNEESKREEHKIKKAKSDELKSEELKFKEWEVIHEGIFESKDYKNTAISDSLSFSIVNQIN